MATAGKTARHASAADTTAAVDAFMTSLHDPREPQLRRCARRS
jgi:hypothetical protein